MTAPDISREALRRLLSALGGNAAGEPDKTVWALRDALDAAEAERDRLRAALQQARERIEHEDWQGTCGCFKERDGRCYCLEDHQEILATVNLALGARGEAGT